MVQSSDGFRLSGRGTDVLEDRLARRIRRASKMQYIYLMLLKDHFTKLKIITRPEKEIKNVKGSLELFKNVLLVVPKATIPYLTEKAMWI